MFGKQILIFSLVFLLSNLCQSYGMMLFDLSSINAAGLIVGIPTIVLVSVGLAIYFKERNSLSKRLSSALVTGLLVLALVGIVFVALGSEDSSLLSTTELQANLLGTAGYSIFQLADGNFILNTANQSCTFLVKLDSSYNQIWTKTIRINQEHTVLSRLVPTSDGGYVLGGIVNNQYVLLKTDSEGNIQWINTFNSGAPINYLRAIIQTIDGGFAVAGFGETVEEGLGWIWFAKTDLCGSMQWNKSFSGPVADCPSAIIQTSDGGFIISDVSYSFVPDQGFFRLIRMDTLGNVLWNTTYGGEGYYREPECNLAIATEDGGYFMAGYLWDTDAWVVKTDAEGNLQWNQTYGDRGSSITSVVETQSGYLLGSISNFTNAGLIMTDNLGNLLWNTTFAGITFPLGYEANFNSIICAKNGDYVMVGSKNESVWLAKLNYQNDPGIAFQLILSAIMVSAVAVVITLVISLKKKENHPRDQPTQAHVFLEPKNQIEGLAEKRFIMKFFKIKYGLLGL